jgi:hypothetical protein
MSTATTTVVHSGVSRSANICISVAVIIIVMKAMNMEAEGRRRKGGKFLVSRHKGIRCDD